MFTTGFSMDAKELAEPMNSKSFRWMKQMAAQKNAGVLGSYIVVEKSKYYNRLFFVKPDGSLESYDKRHLFSIAGEGNNYSQGKERLILEWRTWKVMPLICYDLRFPVWSRSRNYEYDVLVYVANWPTPRVNAWDTLLQARAIENLSYCIGVNRIGTDGYEVGYSGHTAVYDYKGQPVLQPQVNNACATTVTLERDSMTTFRERFDFMKESDSFDLK